MSLITKLEQRQEATQKLIELNAQLEKVKAERNKLGLEALKEVVQGIFAADKSLNNFAFGLSVREYNDEGLYPGINHVSRNLDLENDSVDSQYWNSYDYKSTDPIVGQLQALGEDVLSEVLTEYGIVLCTRIEITIEDAYY